MDLFKGMPTLSARRNETVALVVGFLFGGIGLAIYLRSLFDGLMVLVVWIVLATQLDGSGWLVGAAIAAGYGALRVHDSNSRLDAVE